MPNNEVPTDGYNLVSKDSNRHCGGVCMDVNSTVAYNSRSDVDTEKMESVWVDIFSPK